MDIRFRIVEFDKYCKDCKHYELPECEDPCHECLNTTTMEDSHKPLNFDKRNGR